MIDFMRIFYCDLVIGFLLVPPVLHDCYNRDREMCYSVCGMMHIKDPLLLIEEISPCGDDRWFHHIYLNDPLLYVRRHRTVNKTC